MTGGESERRREPRRAVRIACEVLAGGTRYVALLRDLSAKGALLELLDDDPFAHEGDVEIHIPRADPVKGAVRHRRRDLVSGLVRGIGVEFEAPRPDLLERAEGERPAPG